MNLTGNDTVDSRKRADWSPQEANHSLWCYLPVTLSIAAAVADPAGFEATQRKIPSSVKFTWRITRDPVGRILNRSSEGMGWSPFGPDAHAMRGAGWPRALQLNIPDWPWVLVTSFGACVIEVGTVEIEKKQNAWDCSQLLADVHKQKSHLIQNHSSVFFFFSIFVILLTLQSGYHRVIFIFFGSFLRDVWRKTTKFTSSKKKALFLDLHKWGFSIWWTE